MGTSGIMNSKECLCSQRVQQTDKDFPLSKNYREDQKRTLPTTQCQANLSLRNNMYLIF